MNHLHCTTCKFTLLCTPEEVPGYKANIPLHCGQPMKPDGNPDVTAPTPVAAGPAPAAPAEVKKKPRGKKK